MQIFSYPGYFLIDPGRYGLTILDNNTMILDMNITSPGQPVTTTTNLTSLLAAAGGSSARAYATLLDYNMGNNALLLSMPMHMFYSMSEVANEANLRDKEVYQGEEVAQRKLDPKHAQKLGVYILKGLFSALRNHYKSLNKPYPPVLDSMIKVLGEQPYLSLQPITANIRQCLPQGDGLQVEHTPGGGFRVYLGDLHVLWIVDGQHRRQAMHLLFEFLKHIQLHRAYPKKNNLYQAPEGEETPDLSSEELAIWNEVYEMARSKCTVAVEVHLGLNAEQERQLFHDLNNLTKKVESALAFIFDSSNPVNLFIKKTLKEDSVLKATISETDKVDWNNDQGEISWKDLVAVNARLFLNKNNISGALPSDINAKEEVAIRFWEAINEVPDFGAPGARKKTVLAQPVVLKALAKLAYDFNWGKNPDSEAFDKLMDNLQDVDFSHSNPMWNYYNLDESARDEQFDGLAAYLPKADGANRDIGSLDQTNLMRFGAKHNDIFPVVGDIIRWKLQLPNRHAGEVQELKLA